MIDQSGRSLFYFGCSGGRSGHTLHTSENGHLQSTLSTPSDFRRRFGEHGERLDGTYCPPRGWAPQHYVESDVVGWRIISWHDYSVDGRLGSHSTFVGFGWASFDEMLAAARENFKEVFDRQGTVRRAFFPEHEKANQPA